MSKASRARYEANRRNAQPSTGPKSEYGKHRSSQNALRHGLSGRVVVLPAEDMDEYRCFSKEFVDSLDAQTPVERQYAQTVADSFWRLNRARTIEDGMIAMGHFEDEGDFVADSPEIHSALTAAKVFRNRSKDFSNLSLYEQRIARAREQAFKALRELRAERKAAASQTPLERTAQAAGSSVNQAAGSSVNHAATNTASPSATITSGNIGFVYSTTEIRPTPPQKTLLESTESRAA